ncbi:hypothetical protein PFISCL1PPCAC_3591, partial [Pristionchus fissidentatus]
RSVPTGTITWTVDSPDALRNGRSPSVEVGSLSWWLTTSCHSKDDKEYLSLFLTTQKSLSPIWGITVCAQFAIANALNPDKPRKGELIGREYCTGSTSWGWTTFMKWDDLTNVAKGFSGADGKIKIEVKFSMTDF